MTEKQEKEFKDKFILPQLVSVAGGKSTFSDHLVGKPENLKDWINQNFISRDEVELSRTEEDEEIFLIMKSTAAYEFEKDKIDTLISYIKSKLSHRN